MNPIYIVCIFLVSLVCKANEVKKIDKILTIQPKQIKSSIHLKENISQPELAPTLQITSSLPAMNEIEQRTEQKRPVEKWPEPRRDTQLKLFPLIADSKQVYVSLYGDGTMLSNDLTKEIMEEFKDSISKESFYIQGKSVDKILNAMGFSKTDSLFWFSFDEKILSKYPVDKIDKLLIKPNGAGGEIFGTVGIPVSLNTNPNKGSTAAIGLGFIGKDNPFESYESTLPNWVTESSFVKNKTLELASFISLIPQEGERSIEHDLEFQAIKFPSGEFIRGQAIFKRKDYLEQESYEENLYGYFLRINQKLMTVYDFYIDSTYYQKPEVILVGKWIKGYDFTAYISSTGMGDCGKFILVKGTESKIIPVRCGIWGC